MGEIYYINTQCRYKEGEYICKTIGDLYTSISAAILAAVNVYEIELSQPLDYNQTPLVLHDSNENLIGICYKNANIKDAIVRSLVYEKNNIGQYIRSIAKDPLFNTTEITVNNSNIINLINDIEKSKEAKLALINLGIGLDVFENDIDFDIKKAVITKKRGY